MFSIQDLKSVPSKHDISGRAPEGEQAYLISEVVIHQGLAKLLPHTHLTPLASTGNMHTYSVQVRGYTVAQFVAVATAFATGDFAEGQRLINEISPPRREEW